MTLADYLTREKTSPAAFAEKVGVPASTISRILKGDRSPRLETIAKIEEATDGAVTANDFMAAHAAPQPVEDAA